jgi:hypothetical protein
MVLNPYLSAFPFRDQRHQRSKKTILPSLFPKKTGKNENKVNCSNEARIDLKAFTPQNKRLKIARAICAKQSTNNDNEKIIQSIKAQLVMAWITGIFKCVVLQ